ncbi:ribosome biogenesis GTP-binding protein YihA/YsxC [Hyphobacterium marinum]|uniref:ribosome biogenesis GTP-binding protein YihA/YsxC n=1 Tax=Hyphobacterium marinum TaxID=3116574 RepID=UPI0035A10BC6
MFSRPVTFLRGAVKLDDLPPTDLPEVAFAGRSNVGKSSLINALARQKQLARASGEPGRTRELNFFDLDGKIRLVDLPGYGFAKAPKKEAERWTRLTQNFLKGRPNLKRVYLLIDSRHGFKANDDAVMKEFDVAAVSYQIVLTKTDKLKPAEIEKCLAGVAAKISRRPAAFPDIIATSSAKGDGIAELRGAIAVLTPEFGS